MNTQFNYTVRCGLLLSVVCLLIRYQVGKRRFNRRGIGGVQHFSSYSQAITVTILERFCLFVANICGLAGIFLLAVAGFNHFKF
jgi:hypothetical protein